MLVFFMAVYLFVYIVCVLERQWYEDCCDQNNHCVCKMG